MKIKKTREELEEKISALRLFLFFTIMACGVFVVLICVIGIYPEFMYKYRGLKQQLSECQEQVPVQEELDVTIEGIKGFEKIKLQIWCWNKGYYDGFDSNSTIIWNIIKKCEVIE